MRQILSDKGVEGQRAQTFVVASWMSKWLTGKKFGDTQALLLGSKNDREEYLTGFNDPIFGDCITLMGDLGYSKRPGYKSDYTGVRSEGRKRDLV